MNGGHRTLGGMVLARVGCWREALGQAIKRAAESGDPEAVAYYSEELEELNAVEAACREALT